MLVDLNFEREGKVALLEGLKMTTLLRDLQVALEEPGPGPDAVEIDLTTLLDVELRGVAGLFYGLGCTVDAGRYPKTVWVCFELLQSCLAELKWRSHPANSAPMN
jgi:hypothetical protein